MPNLADYAPADFTPLISSIEAKIFRPIAPLRITAWPTKEPVPFRRRRQGEGKKLVAESRWGAEIFDCAWFLFEGKGVASRDPLALLIDINGELCIYDETGLPLAGLTSVASSFDPLLGRPGKRVFWLPPKIAPGRTFRFWGDAGYNDLFGKLSGDGRIVEARLASYDEAVRQLYYDVVFLVDYFKSVPAQSPIGRRLKSVLRDVVSRWSPEDPGSVHEALHAVRRFQKMKPGAGLLRITTVGHAHLDLAWLWPEREGRRKGVRTMATVLRNVERYPEYRFCASQAQMFAWIKEAEPVLFGKIKAAVKKGKIELVGDSWVEADSNIPSGESLVRQICEGRAFFQREFGTRSKVMFLPDIFGYSAALPQICQGCGIDYFMTQKLSWNKVNRFPHQSFWWEGLDGSRVLVHMLPEETYNGTASPAGLLKAQDNYLDIGACDEALILYGIGDGGGGPGEEHLENLRRASRTFGLPQVRQGSVDGFFRVFSKGAERLPSWKGELYMEGHQGTLTTVTAVKEGNRQAEILLREVEWLLAAEKMLGFDPDEDLTSIWRDILFLQFHDILPGSSIKRVYQETVLVYQKHLEHLKALRETVSQRLAKRWLPAGGEAQTVIVNTLPWRRKGWVKQGRKWRRYDAAAWGPSLLNDTAEPMPPKITGLKAGNGLVEFTLGEKGGIESLRLAGNETEFIPKGEVAGTIRLFQDAGDAWDTPLNYRDAPMRQMEFVSSRKFKSDIEAGFEVEYRLEKSIIRQRISLRADSPLVFIESEIDWYRPWTLLRARFPCAVPEGKATYEIQFGWMERADHQNTSWDAARHECPHQQWVDLSNGQMGVAVLNDSKYGSVIKDGTIEMSLLRCVPYPHGDVKRAELDGDPPAAFSGLGRHRCRYALLPHTGNPGSAGVWRHAREFNLEPSFLTAKGEAPESRPQSLFGWQGSDENFDLSACKISREGRGVILRLNRFHNAAGTLELQPAFPFREIWETNLIEEPIRRLESEVGKIRLEFRPFEVKTLLFRTG
jgi:alpha-mannosidase